MPFDPLPGRAAWRHETAREGFEVAFCETSADGVRVTGSTSAVEDGVAWVVSYEIDLSSAWETRSARVTALGPQGARTVSLQRVGPAGWDVDGLPVPALDGCLDVDLESSALTNAFPLRRLDLPPGAAAEAPAVYVRVEDLRVERLGQSYRHDADGGFDYEAPVFGFSCRMEYDSSGLVLDYPGIAARVV